MRLSAQNVPSVHHRRIRLGVAEEHYCFAAVCEADVKISH
jgi:hypothetical protein